IEVSTDAVGRRLLAVSRADGVVTVRLWEAATGEPAGPPVRIRPSLPDWLKEKEPPASLALSPDGRTLAAGYKDGILVADVARGEPSYPRLAVRGTVTSVAFSTGGRVLLAVVTPTGAREDDGPAHLAHVTVPDDEVGPPGVNPRVQGEVCLW